MDKWLLNNTSTKIIALLLGILLFIVVHKEDAGTVATQPLVTTQWLNAVSIQTIGLDQESLVVGSMSADKVRIQVSGKKTTIASAQPEKYKVILDLTGYTAGRHVIPLKYELPSGVELKSMQPSSVTVVLEELQTQQYDVLVKTQGVPEEGYTAGTPIVRPSNRVHVVLPESRMAEVQSIVGIVDVSDSNESVIQKQVKLTAYDTSGQEMKDAVITPSFVEVEVPITKPFKTVPIQLSLSGGLPAGLSVAEMEPSVNVVTLYGPNSALNKIEFYDGIEVDIAHLTQPGTYNVKVKLTPPTNIEKMEPSSIDVKVTIESSMEQVIQNVPITMTGQSDRLITTIAEPASRQFDVTVIGAPSVVKELTAQDIQLIANVNDLPVGDHQIRLQVNLPRFVSLVDPSIYRANILIRDKDTPVSSPSDSSTNTDANTNPGSTEDVPVNREDEQATQDQTEVSVDSND